MKKIKQTSVFALSALSAALVSHTATVYASDIEIYKAPTAGGAHLMLVLDESASMTQGGTYSQTPITNDYKIGNTDWCSNSGSRNKQGYFDENHQKTFTKLDGRIEPYSYTGRYCLVNESIVNALHNAADKANIINGCTLLNNFTDRWDWVSSGGSRPSWSIQKKSVAARNVYKCSDRMTALKHSLSDLIGNRNYLPDTAIIGMTVFPSPKDLHEPVLLNDEGRLKLLKKIDSFGAGSSTPIAQGYSYGATRLLDSISAGTLECAGYGVYQLTDGEPRNDIYDDTKNWSGVITTHGARGNAINNYLEAGSKLTSLNCSSSWGCVQTTANFLYNKKNTHNIEIKTAIVGFGSEFSFKDLDGNSIIFNKELSSAEVDQLFPIRGKSNGTAQEKADYNNSTYQRAAAQAARVGKGGWFSADNTADIVSSVQNFVNSIKVPIPAITTGTATIPQDALNAVAVQPYAYFPQFKPQPSETFQLWSGNLKKFKVVNSILEDKDGLKVFNYTNGQLNTATKDLWVKNIASSETELLALGGMLSKIKLKGTTANGFNRKVLTNSDTTLNTVTESFIKTNLTNRKYLLGLLGYDLTLTELNAITNTTSLTTLSPSKTLRNIGAIMHSTPILLTQEGKVTQGSSVDTTARKDYLLFGTTQGALHVVKAGAESDTGTSYTGGEEEFVFVPQETLSNQPLALLNEKESGTNGMSQLYYGVDGPWVAHTEYVYNGTDDKFYVKDGTKLGKQWVYGGMRMGGRSYYALDLTDISSPTIKFRVDPTSSTVYTSAKKEDGTNITSYSYSHLAKMGQSWSKPVITNVQWEGKRRLVMFVGGGYDSGYETFNYDQTNGVGAGVFMFDANTGEPLWSTYESVTKGDGANLKYSIVSQIKTIDRDGDGDVDHLYFGDLGGQVFRVDLNSSHPVLNISSTATATQQASAIAASKTNFANNIIRILNVHKANGLSPRFYEAPGFSVYNDTNGIYAVVSIGSGNRSNPLLGKIVNNNYIVSGETPALNAALSNDAIYNLFDTDVVKKDIPSTYTYALRGTTPSELAVVNDTNRELGAKPAATTADPNPQPANKINFTGKKGWYYEFTSSTGRKAVEKVQGDIIVVDNDLYVTTFDAEAVGTTEACGAGIYGGSEAHRFCMPYGQCPAGETVAQNTLNLGKGILGITLGGGTDGKANTRSIVAPVNSRNPSSNKLLATLYKSNIRLTPLSWYEKN
ncbi:PilC/PilY family type IV pilus protein [Acinetobacter indicus]|uniref:PilC/PilY family type IV pilus protein n=1 Tax=Acinetobacter indicus TaxID=756892 RepID=UPI000CECADAD|nr:PilC/PilY family type IV pilus protein [Acinetobacter indicus]